MVSASQAKLERQVVRVAESTLADRRFVTAIDVLVGIGWLSPPLVEDWRRGRIPYLERVVGANLHKISTAMRYLRHWAEQRGLNPSETVYVAWTRERHPLRFSKTGDPNIERAYRTHWVSNELREGKRQRLAERQSYGIEDDQDHRNHDEGRPQEPSAVHRQRGRAQRGERGQHGAATARQTAAGSAVQKRCKTRRTTSNTRARPGT